MSEKPRRPRRTPWIAGIAAFLVVASTAAASAYWTAQTSAAGSVTTTAVSVSHAGFDTPATTKYLPSSLSATRSFTLTNGSGIAGTATATISTGQAYAANYVVKVWQVANAAACTSSTTVPTTGVATGTWAATTVSATLAAGATATMCVRSSITDWRTATDASGGQTVNPVLSVAIDASGWAASAPSTATNAQTTAGMYPLLTGTFFDPALSSTWHTVRPASTSTLCLDVSGSGGAGTSVLTWTCHDGANQRWQFLPVSGTDQSLVTIRPRNAPGTRVTTATGGAVTVETASTAVTQQWYVQRVSSTQYQLVSASTGKCLPLAGTSSNTQMVTVDCDSAQARLLFQREALTVTTATTTSGWWWNTTTTTTVTVSISTLAGQSLTIQRQNGNTWESEATIAAGDSAGSFTHSDLSTGNNTLRIVFGTGTDVAYGPFVLNRNGTTVTVVSGVG